MYTRHGDIHPDLSQASELFVSRPNFRDSLAKFTESLINQPEYDREMNPVQPG
jgi:hypothetical protein